MKSVLIFLAVVAVASAASLKAKRAVKTQNPLAFAALDQLRGKSRLSVPDQYNLIATAQAGQDYPNNAVIEQGFFDCSSTHQPGFYADPSASSRCQIFHRCDVNGNQTSYLCPNMTVFNQITLVCNWWFDVDCSKAASFYDYSNSRLYQGANVPLLDDVVRKVTGAVASGRVEVAAAPAPEEAAPVEAPAAEAAPEAAPAEAAAQ
ncbi:uncharacterized protein LOC129595234 [Paramacrobiotus metropolitanus]|uniref:uncharacterized protein LOC129595234 n=1 Tax=Paramacrobiotus metropolitanus TaxID=2943436 RepID=UPI002445D7C3|nr:uncharacterized protein LOC129595234 [Paramacrobiotus metropolitanus]XP_055348143.1 uncharacterized protein LOC129595234 [Paramacrobiotus metropolitanus]